MSESGGDFGIKKKLKVKSEGAWIFSFADMSLILMSFFALMLSYSTPNKERFDNIKSTAVDSPKQKKASNKEEFKVDKVNLSTISKDLLREIKKQNINASVSYDADGVKVEFDDKLFFQSGAADLQAMDRNLTNKLLTIIAKSPQRYRLTFEGHTDDVPPGKKLKYADNWELSSARARTMLQEMVRRGVPQERMSVTAYAQTRPKIAFVGKKGRELDEARRANRRVVIRIE